MLPLFYLHTAPEVLAIPETVPISGGQSIEPHSTRVVFVSVPTLEEGVGAALRRTVVTLMIGGTTLQTNVIMSGETLSYTSTLYGTQPSGQLGVIYVRRVVGDDLDSRRFDILRRLNTPDYEVVGIVPGESTPPLQAGRQTVTVEDAAMLRMPIREIVRRFTSVFALSNTVIAPSIATFSGFATDPQSTGSAFIALPEESHIVLSISLAGTDAALLSAIPALQQVDTPWQPDIKMTSAGWTVFGVLWATFAVAFLVSVGVAYGWYLAQYL